MIPVQLIFSVGQKNLRADVETALRIGYKWIQLRVSDSPKKKEEKLIEDLKEVCRNNEATLVVEDNIELVKKLEVDGVHLSIANVADARRTLGEGFIIGATVKDVSEIIVAKKTSADYVAVKTDKDIENIPSTPLQFYTDITNELLNKDIRIPVVACGKINVANLLSIIDTGINGIAVTADDIEGGIADLFAECERY